MATTISGDNGIDKVASGTVDLTTDVTGVLPQAQGGTGSSSFPINIGIGANQTWTNLTGSRSASTTYTNSTGKPIQLSVRNTNAVTITVNGLALGFLSSAAGSTMNAIIPNGGTYSYTGTIDSWFELR
jgi:hypothetical protein